MKELTKNVILSDFENTASNHLVLLILFGVFLLFIIFILTLSSIKSKKDETQYKEKSKKYKYFCFVIFLVPVILFTYLYINDINILNNFKYSVATDKIIRKANFTDYNDNGVYYEYFIIYLSDDTKIRVSESEYRHFSENEDVYVVEVKNVNEKEYSTQLYSMREYVYNN